MDTVAKYLPWGLSAASLLMAYLQGNLWKRVWLFGIGIQCLWLLWIFASKQYGFLPLCLALFVMYGRNHLKWRAKSLEAAPPVVERSVQDDLDSAWTAANLPPTNNPSAAQQHGPLTIREQMAAGDMWVRENTKLAAEPARLNVYEQWGGAPEPRAEARTLATEITNALYAKVDDLQWFLRSGAGRRGRPLSVLLDFNTTPKEPVVTLITKGVDYADAILLLAQALPGRPRAFITGDQGTLTIAADVLLEFRVPRWS